MISVKDKAEVLMQVDQLNGVKDELTEQVTHLSDSKLFLGFD